MPYTAHGNPIKTYVRGWVIDPNRKARSDFGFGCLFTTIVVVCAIIVALALFVH